MSKLARDANSAPIQVLRPTTVTRISVSGTAAGTAGIPEGVRVVRVVSPVDCFYSVTGAATTSSTYLPANAIEYIHVYENNVVSVITSGVTGFAYVTQMV